MALGGGIRGDVRCSVQVALGGGIRGMSGALCRWH